MPMAASSSSSMVVDLGEAADLDDATSKLFFSDSDGVELGLSWSAASEITSTLISQDSLVALWDMHGVPSELTPVCAHHLGWRACTPPPEDSNKMCVYSVALDAGLRFPLHEFYVKVLRRYRLAPSQLTPNAWTYMAAFVLLCDDAGVEPLVSAFRYFFTLYGHRHQGEPTGYHHFQVYHEGSRHRLFSGNLPQWRSGWKSSFFFLDCPSRWKCPVKWGRPKREDARRVQLTDTVIEKLKQMGCIDIRRFLANRDMPVGDQAALAPLQSAAKAEAGAATVGASAKSESSRKRSRLSPPPAVLSQPQPVPPSPPPGFAPMSASSTGNRSGQVPPPGFAPIRASSTGCRSGHIPPPQQQSFGESTSAPVEVPGRMVARARAASIGGSSEGQVTPPAPHRMCASDALQLWEAKAKASEQEAVIVKLNQELHMVKTWNARCKMEREEELREATDHNNHLKEELARLHGQLIGHRRMASDGLAQLKEVHAADVARLKKEHAAEKAQLKEELTAERLHRESYDMGVRDMMDLTLTLYEGVISPDRLKREAEVLMDVEAGDALLRAVNVEDE